MLEHLTPDSGLARYCSAHGLSRSNVHSLVMLAWPMALLSISIRRLWYTALILANCGGRLSGARYESYPYIGQCPPTPSHHASHRTCCNSSFNTLNLSVSRMLQYKRLERERVKTELGDPAAYKRKVLRGPGCQSAHYQGEV